MRAHKGVLIAVSFALVYALVLFARGHPYDQDQLALSLPYARVLRSALKAGSFPLWTNLIACGYPVHAEGQGGFLLLPFKVVALLAGDLVAGIELEITLALVLAAASGALAARLLGRSHEAAAAAGIVWAFGGGLLSYQENPAVLEACFSLPLLVALGKRGGRVAVAVGGALVGAMLLAGWPYALLLALPVLVFAWRPRELALVLGLGALLGAGQWIPTAELFFHSDRAAGLDSKEILGQASFAAGDLVRLASPSIDMAKRVTEESVVFAYLGLPAILLVGLGIRAALGRRERLLPIVLGVALALLLLPNAMPTLAAKLVSVPPFSFVRGPSKLLIVVGLASSLLVAEGVDALGKRGLWALVLVALDLFQFGQRRALPVERALFRVTPDVAGPIAPFVRAASFMARPLDWQPALDASAYRAYAQLDPNTNVLYGIPLVEGYGPLPVARSKRVAVELRVGMLARAACELLVVPPDHPLIRFEKVARTRNREIQKVPAPVPLARLVDAAAVASSSESAFELAASLPATTAILEEPLGHEIVGGRAHIKKDADDEVEVAVESEGDALLVVAQTWFPGWEASVDGAPAPCLRADYAFTAVPVPKGAKTVHLRYRPTSFRVGLALSALGASLLLVLARRRPT